MRFSSAQPDSAEGEDITLNMKSKCRKSCWKQQTSITLSVTEM